MTGKKLFEKAHSMAKRHNVPFMELLILPMEEQGFPRKFQYKVFKMEGKPKVGGHYMQRLSAERISEYLTIAETHIREKKFS